MPKLIPGYRDEVKEKILSVVWQVLMDKGVQESTMDDFAKALNCSKGAIYNYFRDKEELLEEGIAAGRLRFRDELFSRFASGNFFSNAEKYFDIEIISASGKMQTTLGIAIEGSRNEKIREAMKTKYDAVVESIADLLGDLTSSGKIVLRDDVDSAARSFYTLQYGVLMSLFSGIPKEDARKTWMNGIRSIALEG